jgi:hypothetical protein
MTAALVQSILDRFLRKYLKNVTTEHATVWGGQLTFKNVELNLDALQEEVGLPVVFHRGFVQELKVLLPLANLLREHIRVTLNNVEVVAHKPASLHTPASSNAHAASATPRAKKEPASPMHRAASSSSGADDKGMLEEWMKTILSRIAINLKVEVFNMVFKYENVSFVSSVSWKRLSLEPLNHRWQPAFVDFHGIQACTPTCSPSPSLTRAHAHATFPDTLMHALCPRTVQGVIPGN